MRPLLLLLTSASAYRTGKTKIQRREPWVVAERFCFEGRATFDYSIKTRGGTRMYVYGSKDQKSFREKVDKKSYHSMSMQKRFERADTEVVLTPGMTTSGDLKFAVDSGQTFVHVVIANFNASCNAICQDQFSCNAEFSKRCYGPVEAEYDMTFLGRPRRRAEQRVEERRRSRCGRLGVVAAGAEAEEGEHGARFLRWAAPGHNHLEPRRRFLSRVGRAAAWSQYPARVNGQPFLLCLARIDRAPQTRFCSLVSYHR